MSYQYNPTTFQPTTQSTPQQPIPIHQHQLPIPNPQQQHLTKSANEHYTRNNDGLTPQLIQPTTAFTGVHHSFSHCISSPRLQTLTSGSGSAFQAGLTAALRPTGQSNPSLQPSPMQFLEAPLQLAVSLLSKFIHYSSIQQQLQQQQQQLQLQQQSSQYNNSNQKQQQIINQTQGNKYSTPLPVTSIYTIIEGRRMSPEHQNDLISSPNRPLSTFHLSPTPDWVPIIFRKQEYTLPSSTHNNMNSFGFTTPNNNNLMALQQVPNTTQQQSSTQQLTTEMKHIIQNLSTLHFGGLYIPRLIVLFRALITTTNPQLAIKLGYENLSYLYTSYSPLSLQSATTNLISKNFLNYHLLRSMGPEDEFFNRFQQGYLLTLANNGTDDGFDMTSFLSPGSAQNSDFDYSFVNHSQTNSTNGHNNQHHGQNNTNLTPQQQFWLKTPSELNWTRPKRHWTHTTTNPLPNTPHILCCSLCNFTKNQGSTIQDVCLCTLRTTICCVDQHPLMLLSSQHLYHAPYLSNPTQLLQYNPITGQRNVVAAHKHHKRQQLQHKQQQQQQQITNKGINSIDDDFDQSVVFGDVLSVDLLNPIPSEPFIYPMQPEDLPIRPLCTQNDSTSDFESDILGQNGIQPELNDDDNDDMTVYPPGHNIYTYTNDNNDENGTNNQNCTNLSLETDTNHNNGVNFGFTLQIWYHHKHPSQLQSHSSQQQPQQQSANQQQVRLQPGYKGQHGTVNQMIQNSSQQPHLCTCELLSELEVSLSTLGLDSTVFPTSPSNIGHMDPYQTQGKFLLEQKFSFWLDLIQQQLENINDEDEDGIAEVLGHNNMNMNNNNNNTSPRQYQQNGQNGTNSIHMNNDTNPQVIKLKQLRNNLLALLQSPLPLPPSLLVQNGGVQTNPTSSIQTDHFGQTTPTSFTSSSSHRTALTETMNLLVQFLEMVYYEYLAYFESTTGYCTLMLVPITIETRLKKQRFLRDNAMKANPNSTLYPQQQQKSSTTQKSTSTPTTSNNANTNTFTPSQPIWGIQHTILSHIASPFTHNVVANSSFYNTFSSQSLPPHLHTTILGSGQVQLYYTIALTQYRSPFAQIQQTQTIPGLHFSPTSMFPSTQQIAPYNVQLPTNNNMMNNNKQNQLPIQQHNNINNTNANISTQQQQQLNIKGIIDNNKSLEMNPTLLYYPINQYSTSSWIAQRAALHQTIDLSFQPLIPPKQQSQSQQSTPNTQQTSNINIQQNSSIYLPPSTGVMMHNNTKNNQLTPINQQIASSLQSNDFSMGSTPSHSPSISHIDGTYQNQQQNGPNGTNQLKLYEQFDPKILYQTDLNDATKIRQIEQSLLSTLKVKYTGIQSDILTSGLSNQTFDANTDDLHHATIVQSNTGVYDRRFYLLPIPIYDASHHCSTTTITPTIASFYGLQGNSTSQSATTSLSQQYSQYNSNNGSNTALTNYDTNNNNGTNTTNNTNNDPLSSLRHQKHRNPCFACSNRLKMQAYIFIEPKYSSILTYYMGIYSPLYMKDAYSPITLTEELLNNPTKLTTYHKTQLLPVLIKLQKQSPFSLTFPLDKVLAMPHLTLVENQHLLPATTPSLIQLNGNPNLTLTNMITSDFFTSHGIFIPTAPRISTHGPPIKITWSTLKTLSNPLIQPWFYPPNSYNDTDTQNYCHWSHLYNNQDYSLTRDLLLQHFLPIVYDQLGILSKEQSRLDDGADRIDADVFFGASNDSIPFVTKENAKDNKDLKTDLKPIIPTTIRNNSNDDDDDHSDYSDAEELDSDYEDEHHNLFGVENNNHDLLLSDLAFIQQQLQLQRQYNGERDITDTTTTSTTQDNNGKDDQQTTPTKTTPITSHPIQLLTDSKGDLDALFASVSSKTDGNGTTTTTTTTSNLPPTTTIQPLQSHSSTTSNILHKQQSTTSITTSVNNNSTVDDLDDLCDEVLQPTTTNGSPIINMKQSSVNSTTSMNNEPHMNRSPTVDDLFDEIIEPSTIKGQSSTTTSTTSSNNQNGTNTIKLHQFNNAMTQKSSQPSLLFYSFSDNNDSSSTNDTTHHITQSQPDINNNNSNPILSLSQPNLYFNDFYYAQAATFGLSTVPCIQPQTTIINNTTQQKETISVVFPILDQQQIQQQIDDEQGQLQNGPIFSPYPFPSISTLPPNIQSLSFPPTL